MASAMLDYVIALLSPTVKLGIKFAKLHPIGGPLARLYARKRFVHIPESKMTLMKNKKHGANKTKRVINKTGDDDLYCSMVYQPIGNY